MSYEPEDKAEAISTFYERLKPALQRLGYYPSVTDTSHKSFLFFTLEYQIDDRGKWLVSHVLLIDFEWLFCEATSLTVGDMAREIVGELN